MIRDCFIKEYGGDRDKVDVFFSPGRVNLIGEHIDYNGGFVFPGALTIGIYAGCREREDRIIRMRSLNAKGELIIYLDDEIKYTKEDGWGNYPKGVIKALIDRGHDLKGMDILYSGNLPDGCGLSSSAAIEVLTAYLLLKGDCDRVEIAKLCQRVENEFIGVNCGIMDQFSVAAGKENMGILLNCETLDYSYVPFDLKNYKLIIMNTNKKRGLAGSKYNERRSECDSAFEILNGIREIKNLCEANIEDVERYIEDDILKRRARHAVTENKRVIEAVDVLKNGDIEAFGKLLILSHESLKNDYEVTGFELDTIVEEALNFDGCIGARMTGAGFGGCGIALVKEDLVDDFIKTVGAKYLEKTHLTPSFYVSSIGDGVKQLA